MTDTLSFPNACLEYLPDISALPLKELDIHGNRFVGLDGLPDTLERLNISDNRLEQDGIFLPFPSLKILHAEKNNLSIFDNEDFIICFPSLTHLNLSSNKLKVTGFLRDSTVEHLNVSQNRIHLLSGLPLTLKTLIADTNSITMIQSKLPPSLESIDLTYNSLRYAGLPVNWPSALRELHLDHNLIEKFPRKLPDSLEILSLNHNRITELPNILPASLQFFIASHNRIRFLPNYKNHKRFTVFLVDNNCLLQTPDDTRAKVFSADNNWDQQEHKQAQIIIKNCWKRYLLGLRLRQYCRTQKTKEELFMVSMMPERWEQIDVLDPIWSGRTRSLPHSD
jgi:hypothetical protein